MRSRRVAVIGGGVTGLSTCVFLEQAGFTEVCLFEREARLGGKIETVRESGWVIETGPDSIFTRNREVSELIELVGLSPEVIEPATRGFSIYLDGALRLIPPGVSSVQNIDPVAVNSFEWLSPAGKAAVLAEGSVAPNLDADESIASFFSRRLGNEYSVKIAEPLFAGTHGGRAGELSMGALYPSFRKAERNYGSLAAAARSGQSSPARFISFRGGTQSLTDAARNFLKRTQIHNEEVTELKVEGSGVRVQGLEFDSAVVAVPAHEASQVLKGVSPDAAERLGAFRAAGGTVVSLGYQASPTALKLRGTGFLVPESVESKVKGATWSSQKWLFRCSDDAALLRVFLWSDLWSDSEAVAEAVDGLKRIHGLEAAPSCSRVHRWPRGLPQYEIGHAERVDEIAASVLRAGPVLLAGQSYRGIGIADCVRQARVAADSIAAWGGVSTVEPIRSVSHSAT